MIYRFTTHLNEAWNSEVNEFRRRTGLADLHVSRDYYLEASERLSDDQLHKLCSILRHNPLETVHQTSMDLQKGAVQVTYKQGIVDNENDSVVSLCRLFAIPVVAAKLASTFASESELLEVAVREHCHNPNIEDVHTVQPFDKSLGPKGTHSPMVTYDLRSLDEESLEQLGRQNGRNLSMRQMEKIRSIQVETNAAYVSDVLVEALDARWSDHCSHTTWRSLGRLLDRLMSASKSTRNKNIVSMFHDNAGVWDFYDGDCLVIKAETHNGPSAISAYFGQLTKIGGVLRDILGTGKGADPIGVFEYTATGPLAATSPIPHRPSPKQIAWETIRAVKEYGNTFGVPMLQSKMAHHPKYRAKPFALGGSVGIIPRKFAAKGEPEPGDHLMLIGGLTGNDGIHGASASSAGSTMDSASVQIGAPLEQVKFRQAIIDLRDAGCIRALTDVGGAGLNSAIGEIGENTGIWFNTALVPLKTSGLPMWRILLSESQERMILAIIPEKLETCQTILRRHDVRNTVVGKFTNSHSYCVVHAEDIAESDVIFNDFDSMPIVGEVGIDVPYNLIDDEPEPAEVSEPIFVPITQPWPSTSSLDLAEMMEFFAQSPELYSQQYADSQYDSTVQGQSYYGPTYGSQHKVRTSFTAITPKLGSPYAAVFSSVFDPWLYDANPTLATRQSFLALLTSQILAGIDLCDICLCDNFYTPHKEENSAYWLRSMVDELSRLVRCFGTPLISGKDSSAGSVQTPEGMISVPPAVFLSAVGKIANCNHLLKNDWTAGETTVLVRIGPTCNSIAGTLAARVLGVTANDLDEVDVGHHLAFLQALAECHSSLLSGVTIGSGGIIGQLMLGALANGRGVVTNDNVEPLELLKEHRCGALIEIRKGDFSKLPVELQPMLVGTVNDHGPSLMVNGTELMSPRLIDAWINTFARSLE